MGADYSEFTIHSGGTISLMGLTDTGNGHFALDTHEVGSVSIVNTSGYYIAVHEIGTVHVAEPIEVVDLDLEAIGKVSLQNFPQPAANTNILSNNLVPSFSPADFRIQTIMSNSGNLSVVMIRGGNSQVGLLNVNSPIGITLIPGALYTFDVLVNTSDSINLRYSNTGGTIRTLRIQELDASAY
jgi:hypothetical protein